MKRKIIVFGLGKIFRTFLKNYDPEKVDILALSDNKAGDGVCGIGSVFENYPVIRPEQIKDYDFDYIVITSSYYDGIKKQLTELGIDEHSILGFADIYQKLIYIDNPVMDFMKDDLQAAVAAQKSNILGFEKLKEMQEKALFLQAKACIDCMKNKRIDLLEEVEFQVFSQWGEDGIIQWLINNIDVGNKVFVEFGVEDYRESNTRFLLMNNNWSGLVIDGDKENVKRIKQWRPYWKYDLEAVDCFITKDNINSIISEAGIKGDIGLLSVDIDGNDYWILNEIDCIQPRILICEYNNIFGPDKKVTVPYDKTFFRTEKHYSNLYWGCSLKALRSWAEEKGFYYVGTNSAGNNAFFVRKDCIAEDKLPKERNLFIESKYRESRDEKGKLTFVRGDERLKLIKEMELMNLENGEVEYIKDIYQL